MPGYRAHVALVYNVTGQTLEFYPPSDELRLYGAPTAAATYTVWRGEDGNDTTAQFSGTATLDAVSTTTDAACGPSQARRNRVPLASTTSVTPYRRYLLTNAAASGGQRLIVTPVAVLSTDSVDLESDVPIDVASGSTFVGLRHVFTVDPTFIALSTNINVFGSRITVSPGSSGSTQTSAPPYRVRWRYLTADGLTREYWTTFDVCRAPAEHSIDKAALLELMPDVAFEEWAGQRGQDFAPQIRASWERVKWEVRMAGYDVDMLSQDTEVLDRLTLLATRAQLAQLGCRPRDRDANEYAAECETIFVKALNDAVTVTLKAWTQTDASGAIAIETSQQLWFTR